MREQIKTAVNWAKVKNGNLSNGGYNRSPKEWDETTGLCKNPNKK